MDEERNLFQTCSTEAFYPLDFQVRQHESSLRAALSILIEICAAAINKVSCIEKRISACPTLFARRACAPLEDCLKPTAQFRLGCHTCPRHDTYIFQSMSSCCSFKNYCCRQWFLLPSIFCIFQFLLVFQRAEKTVETAYFFGDMEHGK